MNGLPTSSWMLLSGCWPSVGVGENEAGRDLRRAMELGCPPLLPLFPDSQRPMAGLRHTQDPCMFCTRFNMPEQPQESAVAAVVPYRYTRLMLFTVYSKNRAMWEQESACTRCFFSL